MNPGCHGAAGRSFVLVLVSSIASKTLSTKKATQSQTFATPSKQRSLSDGEGEYKFGDNTIPMYGIKTNFALELGKQRRGFRHGRRLCL